MGVARILFGVIARGNGDLMQAFVHETYGGRGVLELLAIDTPTPDDGRVLVRVHAASVNAYDWHMLTGLPYIGRLGEGLRRPKTQTPGVDVAGTVEAVGRNVTQFQPGDEVFGPPTGVLRNTPAPARRTSSPSQLVVAV